MQGSPGFLCVVPLLDFLSLSDQSGQFGGVGPKNQGLHCFGKSLGGGIHLRNAGILICLNGFGTFQAFLKGLPAVRGIILFLFGFRFRDDGVEVGLIADLLQAGNGIIELLYHSGLFLCSEFLLLQDRLLAAAAARHRNLAGGPNFLHLCRYFADGVLQGFIGFAGICGTGDLFCAPQAVLQIFFRVFDFFQGCPIYFHSGVLVAGGWHNRIHHRDENMYIGRIFMSIFCCGSRLDGILKLYPNGGHVNGNEMGVRHIFYIQRTLVVITKSRRTIGAAVINVRRIRIVIAVIDSGSLLGQMTGEDVHSTKAGGIGIPHRVKNSTELRQILGIYPFQLHHKAVLSNETHRHKLHNCGGGVVLYHNNGTVIRIFRMVGFKGCAASQGRVTHRRLIHRGVPQVNVCVIDAILYRHVNFLDRRSGFQRGSKGICSTNGE